MKKSVLFILSLFSGLELFAQVPVRDLNITRRDNQVSVSFRMDIPKNYVKRDYKQTIVPVLFNSDGEIGLPPVCIAGKIKIKREKQEQALSGKELFMGGNYQTNGSSVNYNVTVPYQPWMKNVSFGVDTQMEGCCNVVSGGRFVLADNIVLKKDFVPYISAYMPEASPTEKLKEPFILPISDYGKKVKNSLKVYYPQSVSDLETGYMDNTATLDRIDRAVKTMQGDPAVTIKKALITGFASPEGALSFNEKLSGERAKSLEQYLAGHYNLSPAIFDLTNGGIDWDGLEDAVGSSGYAWKNSVLNIIRKAPEGERIAKFKSLDGGIPYKTMYGEIFPNLRKAVNIAFYYEKNDMQQKKRNELFDLVTNREYGKALTQLQSLPEDGWVCNMIGVCYEMTGNGEKAREYFNKAVSMGYSGASKNLKQLNQP